jgi:hypothetical protein
VAAEVWFGPVGEGRLETLLFDKETASVVAGWLSQVIGVEKNEHVQHIEIDGLQVTLRYNPNWLGDVSIQAMSETRNDVFTLPGAVFVRVAQIIANHVVREMYNLPPKRGGGYAEDWAAR